MCDPCCLYVDYKNTTKYAEPPNDNLQNSEKILCPHCSSISDIVYRKNDYTFRICFIPLIPCYSSDPFLACYNCNGQLSFVRKYPCQQCGISRTFDGNYCPNCGQKCL